MGEFLALERAWPRRWLSHRRQRAMIAQTFNAARTNPRLDMGVVETSIAAAETIAARCGNPNPDLPVELAAWARASRLRLRSLVPEALALVATLRNAPQFGELWFRHADYAAWQHNVDGLITRLTASSSDRH